MSEGAAATAEGEAGRARPLSGGLWTLFSWLRRDERSSSSDSLSSAGSDRTAVSFAFLAPPPPRVRASPLPALAPPTDSYKKRVRDRHLQRQNDRDLTLHRKYGLYYGYDAFSLPPAHKRFVDTDDHQDRDRRAISESLPRRAAHVPGKRRAPLPPTRPHSVLSTTSLTRHHNRKRPAPQPPIKSTENSKENISDKDLTMGDIEMNSKSKNKAEAATELNNANGCKLQKYSKKNTKDTKNRSEKSFLKQIFENKKRNSTLEPVPERILPNISELDKQAAEIIDLCRLKPLEQNNNLSEASSPQSQTWFCTRCLKKYDSTIVTCQQCLPEQKRLCTLGADSVPSTSSNTYTQTEQRRTIKTSNRESIIGDDEKQKLREMLKEMKKSLPKRSKNETDDNMQRNENIFKFETQGTSESSLETPTLRIGATIVHEQMDQDKNKTNFEAAEISPKVKPELVKHNVIITQHVVLMAPGNKVAVNASRDNASGIDSSITANKKIVEQGTKGALHLRTDESKIKLNTPLNISSLLNPIYIPKSVSTNQESARNTFFSKTETENINLRTDTTAKTGIPKSEAHNSNLESTAKVAADKTKIKSILNQDPISKTRENKLIEATTSTTKLIEARTSTNQDNKNGNANVLSKSNDAPDVTKLKQSNMVRFNVEQHSRRRELINQLEQSIAKGDERAAADAAAKLAQLRLSCSVLSFTSQIISDNQKPKSQIDKSTSKKITADAEQAFVPTVKPNKIDAAVQLGTTEASSSNMKTKVLGKSTKNEIQEGKSATSTCKVVNVNHKENVNENLHKQNVVQPSTSSQSGNENSNNHTTIQVWVEDREATRGPVRLRISRQAVMGELRRQAETSFGLAGVLQRWIVGRTLCTDDRTPLVTLAGSDLAAPFYLCVVESENKVSKTNTAVTTNNGRTVSEETNGKTVSDVYSELVQLEQHALVRNAEPFECNVCMEECGVGAGAVLRECIHTFCRECLADLIRHCGEPVVSCPAMGCLGILQEREIRALVTPEEYERWLTRGLVAAESGNRNAFHCRTRDCTGWAFCDPGVRRFPCPVCQHTNCIPCQAIHESESCEQYQAKLIKATTSSQSDEGTETLLTSLIEKGEALKCPECSAIITKKWGCDWVKCSACKTEICWVTRGRRWGPGGKGDTTGGCRCGVDGKRCHPLCGYCH